jgi:LPXTG-site transpeptidase (sortase) family protein
LPEAGYGEITIGNRRLGRKSVVAVAHPPLEKRAMPLSVKAVLKNIEYALALGGIALVVYVAAELVRLDIYQNVKEKEFSNLKPLKDATKPTAGSTRELRARGSVIGRIDVPRISLSTVIVEGDGDKELELAAGHIPGTAYPGEFGNTAIAGHRDTVFRALRFIRKNDSLTVTTQRGQFTYRVTSTQIVQPENVHVLDPTESETLTLVTCYPFYFVGPAPRRFIVRAAREAPTPRLSVWIPPR